MKRDVTTTIALTTAEAARSLGIGKTKLFELIASGAIPAVRLGGRTLVRRDDLEAFTAQLPRWAPRGRSD